MTKKYLGRKMLDMTPPTTPKAVGEIGDHIIHVSEVCQIADEGGSIWHERLKRPVAGAWLQNMPARLIVGYIRMGWLRYYTPLRKKKTA